MRRTSALLVFAACLSATAGTAVVAAAAESAADRDVLPEYRNREVTALVEDSEALRLALGVAWDDALAARAFAGYLRPWTQTDPGPEAEAMVKRGTRFYEEVKCIDDGINSVRLARDTRDEPRLPDEMEFWRRELAFAAMHVQQYVTEAGALKAKLAQQLAEQAQSRGVSVATTAPRPWADPQREAWRRAGPATGVRLPLEPRPGSIAEWWNTNLSLQPGYLVSKLHSAGARFFTPEIPVGAWGISCTGKGQYDWTRLNGVVRLVAERGGSLLLELPTLTERKTADDVAKLSAQADKNSQYMLWPAGYAPALPEYLAAAPGASLVARDAEGKLVPHGAVQLLNPEIAQAYGEYLLALAANLKQEKLHDAIAAIHLEQGDAAELPDNVDYSEFAKTRWQKFMAARYGTIAALNQAAGTAFAEFAALGVPVRTLDPRAAADWAAFTAQAKGKEHSANAWRGFLRGKYKTDDAIRQALGDDYLDGYGARLPFVYPPVIGMDYMHFRRAWVEEYLAIKRRLVTAAFPDKLLITEWRQFGDHDGVQGLGEKKWGGFLNEDNAQWTSLGTGYEGKPFQIRSVGPPGFGTRPSDSLESLFREYLWLNFRDPGNLTRYFYHWVAHGYMDYQLGWHSVTNHWLTDQLLYALGPTVANTLPQPQRIGLLMPRTTHDLNDGAIYYDYMGWDWTLQAAKLPYTRIDEAVIRAGGLRKAGLELLILPGATALDDQVAAEIADWVKAGGTLIAAGMPGVTDAYGRPRPQPALAATLGVSVAGTVSEAVKDTPLTVTVPHGHYSGKWQEKTDRKPQFQVLVPMAATANGGDGQDRRPGQAGPSKAGQTASDPTTGGPGSSRPQQPAATGGPDKPGPPPGDMNATAEVLYRYTGGGAAITLNRVGKGRAVAMGYPFGTEATECERTSIGFQRTYVWFVREPQLVARTAWLREFITGRLGFRPEFTVEAADVERFEGVEEIAPGFHMPQGVSEDPADPFFIRTVGDPRPAHEIRLKHETPDLALRFFPRQREGLTTKYVGISTREVHYLGPRATVEMILARHSYRCRIENPRIKALWDVARNVPVGFTADARGVAFEVSLPSGHIMMLATSETPQVELFAPAPFPGRTPEMARMRCRELANSASRWWMLRRTPPGTAVLSSADELRAWAKSLAEPPDPKQPAKKEQLFISYGTSANKAAAERLAQCLRTGFGIDAVPVEQMVKKPTDWTATLGKEYETPVILIGTEWTNNDLAMHGAYWGVAYGAHLPFTATYAWPGEGRAVASLSRRYALISADGRIPFAFNPEIRLRPVERRFPLVRQKLFVAGNGADAEAAVAAVIRELGVPAAE